MPIRPENRGRYPADWPKVRERILARARGRCECPGDCGRGHRGRCIEQHNHRSSWSPRGRAVRIVLTIAHLDHTPENNAETNLRAMCQGCHLHYDIDHHAQTRRETVDRARVDAGQLTLDPAVAT